jgi:hypothetical protein
MVKWNHQVPLLFQRWWSALSREKRMVRRSMVACGVGMVVLFGWFPWPEGLGHEGSFAPDRRGRWIASGRRLRYFRSGPERCETVWAAGARITGEEPVWDWEPLPFITVMRISGLIGFVKSSLQSSLRIVSYMRFQPEFNTVRTSVTMPQECPIPGTGAIFHSKVHIANVQQYKA